MTEIPGAAGMIQPIMASLENIDIALWRRSGAWMCRVVPRSPVGKWSSVEFEVEHSPKLMQALRIIGETARIIGV